MAQVGEAGTGDAKVEAASGLPTGLLLVQTIDWWIRAMEKNAAANGMPPLTRSQGLLVGHLSLGEHRPVRLAEKLGITRQAVHFLIGQLVDMDIVTVRKDPDDLRAIIVDLKPVYTAGSNVYLSIMIALETKLAERMGKENFDVFRAIVGSDWGEPPILKKAEIKRAAKERR